MGEFRLSQFTFVAIYFIALLGLNILTGYNGQISLGHGAFMGIGAYVAAMLIARPARARGAAADAAGLAAARRRDAPDLHDPARGADHRGHRLPVRPARRSGSAASRSRSRRSRWRCRCRGREERSTDVTGGGGGLVLNLPTRPVRLGHLGAALALLRGLGDRRGSSSSSRGCSCAVAPGARGARSATARSRPSSGVSPALYKTLAFGVSAVLRGRRRRAARDRGLVRQPRHVPAHALDPAARERRRRRARRRCRASSSARCCIQFLPIYAQDPPLLPFELSKQSPTVVFGVILILIMFVLPGGVASLIRRATAPIVRNSTVRSARSRSRSCFPSRLSVRFEVVATRTLHPRPHPPARAAARGAARCGRPDRPRRRARHVDGGDRGRGRDHEADPLPPLRRQGRPPRGAGRALRGAS